MPVTVLLVDDEPLVRAGLRAVLEAQPDIKVVGEAGDGAAVIPLVRQLRPDVVAMDVRMPLMDGIEATRVVLRTVPDPPKILVVTTFENDEYVYEALRAGADGFLLKRARLGRDRALGAARGRGRVPAVPGRGPPASPPSTARARLGRPWKRPRSPSAKRPCCG